MENGFGKTASAVLTGLILNKSIHQSCFNFCSLLLCCELASRNVNVLASFNDIILFQRKSVSSREC